MSPSTELPIPQTHCAACGYLLAGLPSTGRCPECGESYDNETLVLSGWSPDRLRPDPSAAIFGAFAMMLSIFLWISVAFNLLAVGFAIVMRNWTGAGGLFLFTLGYAAAAMLLLLFSHVLKRHAAQVSVNMNRLGKPTYQLRLYPEGYACRRGFGPPHELFHWNPDLELTLTLDGPVARIRIARNNPLGITDWSTLVDFSFPATAEQVSALRAYIDSLRANAKTNPP